MRTLLSLALLCFGARAWGYSLATGTTHGCHEAISAQALRSVRAAQPDEAPPIEPDRNERALVDDTPFLLDPDMTDLGGASLLLSVRDNDLKGHDAADSFDVVAINGDPALQMEHCLRAPGDDEPDGTARAIAACRAFVAGRFAEALDGLAADGSIDADHRVILPVWLDLRGARTDASLPLFYVRLGQALHAVQDGFSHTLRTADGRRVTTVLNWVDYADKQLDERRDGPPHMSALDDCTATDPDRLQRRALVQQATEEVMRAALEPGADRETKLARLDQVLDAYFTVEPDCTLDNGYCDTAAEEIRDKGLFGCSVTPGTPSAFPFAFAAALLLLMMRRRLRPLALSFAFAFSFSFAFSSSSAFAEERSELDSIRHDKKLGSRFGFYAAFSGAIDRPAMAGILGLRIRLTPHWLIGLDTELNPWISNGDEDVHLGTLNAYFTAIVRYPLKFSRVNLHQSVNVGASFLLFDVYGAPAGSVGLFAGTTLLGVDLDLGHYVRLVIDPLNLALPIPHLTAAPFYYLQYRITVGFQFGA